MARVDVRLPDMGEGAGDEARVSFWHVEVGEEVEEGDELVEMITDKATFDIPAPVHGRVLEKLAQEDEEIKVGTVLCRLEAIE